MNASPRPVPTPQAVEKKPARVNRREFLVAGAAAGAGLVIGFYLPHQPRTAARIFSPNAFLRVAPDGATTVVVSKAEMGQGVRTAAAMILAEELDADWKQIRIEQAESNERVYGDQGTGGSSSMRELFDPLRRAGAMARGMLVAAAAARWGVTPGRCRTENGAVLHPTSSRRLGYGELADAAATMPVPGRPPTKEPSQYRIIGRRVPRLDTASKLRSFDAARARAIPGVRKVIESNGAVAVLADSTWPALEGRRALALTWDEGPSGELSSAKISAEFRTALSKTPWVYSRGGDFAKSLGSAPRHLQAIYEVPFLAQAPMEPMNATASYHDGVCELWAPSQNSTLEVQAKVARAVGIDPEQVKIYTTLLGGGFGRRLQSDYMEEAARLSKAAGAPVKVTWTREDDMGGGFYRQNGLHRLIGAVDAHGMPVAFRHTLVAPTLDDPPPAESPAMNDAVEDEHPFLYSVPGFQLDYIMANTPVPVGPWRSVYASHLAFATEHFLDELAHLGKKDPMQVRRELLAGDRMVRAGMRSYNTARLRGVLETAAQKAPWGSPAHGRTQGVACWAGWGSYVAQVAEVSVEAGDVRVHRVVCAVDCGRPLNPAIIESQMESAIVFGLSAALKGEITIANGRAQQTNFHDYPVLRMSEMPRIEVYIAASTEAVSGIGEPAVPVIAPAVANAVLAATGKPVRSLPIRLS